MKISVVTAVLNGRGTLPAMIQSLAQQTHPDVEHIVQDGGSTDGTQAYLIAYGHPRMVLVSAGDGGIYAAINAGITRATGDVIGLLHADDQLANAEVLADVARALQDPEIDVARALQDPEIDGVYGDLQYVGRGDPTRVIRRWTAGPFHPSFLRRGWMPPHPTVYLRRTVFDRCGLYDPDFRISGDYDAMLRYLTRGDVRLGYLPQVMVRMQLGGASNRSFAQILRKSREDYRAIRRHQVGGIGTLIAKNLSKLQQFWS